MFICFQSNHTGHATSRLSLFLETLLPLWASLFLLVLCFCARGSDAWNGPTPLPLPPLLIWSLLQIISGYDSCYIPSMQWATHSALCASVSTSMGISLRIPSEYTVKSPKTLSGLSFLWGKAWNQAHLCGPGTDTKPHSGVRTSMTGACNPGTRNCSVRESEAG